MVKFAKRTIPKKIFELFLFDSVRNQNQYNILSYNIPTQISNNRTREVYISSCLSLFFYKLKILHVEISGQIFLPLKTVRSLKLALDLIKQQLKTKK